MTILITGAGLIGCQTARLLVDRGQSVVLVDNRPSREAIASMLPDRSVAIETADICDAAMMKDIMRRHGVTGLLHTAAALSLAFNADPPKGVAVNLQGTVNLLDACRECGVERFVFGSSTTVAHSAFHRQPDRSIGEDFPLHVVSSRPGSFYVASKLAGEFFVHLYADHYGLSVGILRYAAVLGLWAGPNNSLPGRLMRCLLSGRPGERLTIDDPLMLWSGGEDFIDARDVTRANVAALDAAVLPSRVYTIASGKLTGIDAFVEAARELMPTTEIHLPPLPATGFAGFPSPRTQPFDITAALNELRFSPNYDVRSSLQSALPFV